jgi:hypothetical protein
MFGARADNIKLTVPPPPPAKQIHLKHVLVIGETKGFEHDSVSAAIAVIYTAGHDSGLWDTTMRTDTELLTKKPLERNAKSLNSNPVIRLIWQRPYLVWLIMSARLHSQALRAAVWANRA